MTKTNKYKRKEQQRFTAGKLVMLSRKEVKSGSIPYFRDNSDKECEKTTHSKIPSVWLTQVGFLGRGIPILLIENPKQVPFSTGQVFGKYRLFFHRKKDKTSWLIRFVLNGKIYQMYLTKYQYNNELVRAVSKRLKKDYGTNH